ncbi:MAG: 2-phospho-L-lactate transferase CofD family protein, partial [Propionibacteriales bacterium]|nr:2-phospho-L-lactate transferase CofD family protein [Propionibacteriales bacterium]
PSGRRAVHFQEYWVRLRATPPAEATLMVGLDAARPTPEVGAAIASADLVLIAPSNPVVSIGPILGVPGLRAALLAGPGPIIGFSPILGNRPVLGMADKLLPTIGVEVSAEGVGRHYGARPAGGLLDLWVVDEHDAAAAALLADAGLPTLATPLVMHDPAATAVFVRAAEDQLSVS